MNYHDLLARLYAVNKHGGIKLGLENCQQLNLALASPTEKFPSIHIAGTNGKGSTATKIAAALQATGLRVGLYTSPHIACFRERIRINGTMISEEATLAHVSRLLSLAEQQGIPGTFFELTTMAAFDYFAEEKVDIAVVETGLGGRLDATNIIKPRVSVITSISLEHTEILGNTIEEIALEKAGIIKPSVPVVIGPRVPVEVIEAAAVEKGSTCILVKGIFANYHEENKAVAAAALHFLNIPKDAIEIGLAALPPCRMQLLDKDFLTKTFSHIPLPDALVLDVAHNPDGIQHLIAAMEQRFPGCPFRFIVGLSKNKDIPSCLRLLDSASEHLHFVEAQNDRAAPLSFLSDILQVLEVPDSKFTFESSIAAAMRNALTCAGRANQILVVCGTFFIMSEVRAALHIHEPRDFFINASC